VIIYLKIIIKTLTYFNLIIHFLKNERKNQNFILATSKTIQHVQSTLPDDAR